MRDKAERKTRKMEKVRGRTLHYSERAGGEDGVGETAFTTQSHESNGSALLHGKRKGVSEREGDQYEGKNTSVTPNVCKACRLFRVELED